MTAWKAWVRCVVWHAPGAGAGSVCREPSAGCGTTAETGGDSRSASGPCGTLACADAGWLRGRTWPWLWLGAGVCAGESGGREEKRRRCGRERDRETSVARAPLRHSPASAVPADRCTASTRSATRRGTSDPSPVPPPPRRRPSPLRPNCSTRRTPPTAMATWIRATRPTRLLRAMTAPTPRAASLTRPPHQSGALLRQRCRRSNSSRRRDRALGTNASQSGTGSA